LDAACFPLSADGQCTAQNLDRPAHGLRTRIAQGGGGGGGGPVAHGDGHGAGVAGETKPKRQKWLYPVIYLLFVIINFLPPYAEKPYAPQDTQDVILNLLMVSVDPYKQFGPVFHIGTLLIGALVAVFEDKMGRILAAYMGLNYYGLAFCFTTPVFVFLLILFYPKVDAFAYRVTAFNGLLYGLFNVTHFFNPQLRWMGILHLPLLVISLCALILPRVSAKARAITYC
jgi:hypothetical protein